MNAQIVQCPSCGAPVLPRGNSALISCPYCQATVVVPAELRRVSADSTWLTLVYDSFASNTNDWLVGDQSSEYFTHLDRRIADGRYRWDAQVGRPSSITSAWLMGRQVAAFHLLANCKHIRGSRTGSSWGVVFRIQDSQNYYCFRISDSQFFSVTVIQDGKWLNIVDWTITDTIKPYGVNQVEVVAYGTHFTFAVNGQIVRELDDDRFSRGLVGLAIEGYTPEEAITFDFLDIILRAT